MQFTSAQDYAAQRPGSSSLYQPQFGADCRGPLPTNALLKRANDVARQAFADAASFSTKNTTNAFDYRAFYGDTWEFANLFWFHTQRWVPGRDGKWLDCTHHKRWDAEAYGVHRFFLQAMIDAHYDEEEVGNPTVTVKE